MTRLLVLFEHHGRAEIDQLDLRAANRHSRAQRTMATRMKRDAAVCCNYSCPIFGGSVDVAAEAYTHTLSFGRQNLRWPAVQRSALTSLSISPCAGSSSLPFPLHPVPF
eukprot:3627341-Pleurochrysis_carterae.AAC.2